jgi:glycosyltransferase involved in cell wall biosynthesis
MNVLWLRPDKPDNISVGRHRVADVLRDRGHDIEVRNAGLRSFRTVFRTDPDVVVGTTRLGALVGCWKKLLDGTPLVVDHIDPISQLRRTHGRANTWLIARLESLVFTLADHVLVVYEEELDRVRSYNDAVTETALGVDYDSFASPSAEAIEFARGLIAEEGDERRRTLVYVGGLEPVYNLDTTVDAMAHLDGWQFLVLGDGSQRERIEAAAASDDRIVYPGVVPHEHVPGFLHESDVGICLVDDPNTLKLLEYGAARLPAVSVEGRAEDRYDGLVTFCSLVPEDVARAVEESYESAPVDQFQKYTERFGWTAIAEEYESVLESVVSGGFRQ